MKLTDLPTPALLLDADLFEANLQRMAQTVARAGKSLRPHAKAHKCVEIASRQIEAGAVGVCVATVSEAEVMARAGIPGILLTSPVADREKCRRMTELGAMVVVDDELQVQMYAEAAARAGVQLRVLVDLDVGDHRTGIAPGEPALRLARSIASARGLSLAGLQAYSVRASHIEDPKQRAEYSAGVLDAVLRTRDLLTGSGFEVPIVTGGSTGSYLADAELPYMTELQAGSYALMDVAYARIGVDFGQALTVLATVISANYKDRVTVDAGFKAFSTDRPFGPQTEAGRYEWAGDEFGYVFNGGLRPGDRVRFVPPHCDPTVNLYDRIHVCRGDEVVDVWHIMDRMPCRGRIALLKPTAVNSILAEVREAQSQGGQVVSLMRGEPDFRTAPHITEAAVRALQSGRTTYPDNRGEPRLREAIAEKLSRENSLSYDPGTEILVTDGATLGIHVALMSVLEQGDEILLPDPIYDAYQSPIRLAGATARPVKSIRDGGRFRVTVEALEAAYRPSVRALLLNTPWNPVGTVFTRAELEAIAEFVLRRDLVLISDEIYEWITYDGHRHLSPAAVSPELRARCVLVNSLSKTYAMTGWRLGYCAAPRALTKSMFLVLQQSSRGPATFVQDAGIAALTGPQDCVASMRADYGLRRQQVGEALSGLAKADVLLPEGGFFAMVDVSRSGRTSDEVRKQLLREHGVVVAHGRAYGEAGEGTLRVSFASGGDTLKAGLQRLRSGLESL